LITSAAPRAFARSAFSADPAVAVSVMGDVPHTLGAIAGEPDALTVLNAAFAGAPLTVQIAKGAAVAHPVVIIHWIDAEGAATFPRTLVQVGEGAAVTVVEALAVKPATPAALMAAAFAYAELADSPASAFDALAEPATLAPMEAAVPVPT